MSQQQELKEFQRPWNQPTTRPPTPHPFVVPHCAKDELDLTMRDMPMINTKKNILLSRIVPYYLQSRIQSVRHLPKSRRSTTVRRPKVTRSSNHRWSPARPSPLGKEVNEAQSGQSGLSEAMEGLVLENEETRDSHVSSCGNCGHWLVQRECLEEAMEDLVLEIKV